MAEDLLGNFPSDNNFQAEEFEKVEKIPDQDEAVSSSILEDAEADRYHPGNLGTVDNFPDLTDLGPALSSFAKSDPFGQSPEPTAPPKEERDLVSAFDFEDNTVLKSEPQPEVPKPSVAESPKTSSTSPPSETASWLKNVDPRVLELIYWRDYKKTGVVFGSMLFVLLSLAICSVLSVLAYLSLAVLSVTISFRIYKNVLAAVQKSGDAHPFKMLLEMDISMPEDKAQEALTTICKHINCTVKELRRLFLIEDIVDSLKFALLLWVLTYIGSWFNGMTLIIMGLVAIFTLPKVYETYQVQIDNYVAIAAEQVGNIKAQVVSKVPFLKKKEKSQ